MPDEPASHQDSTAAASVPDYLPGVLHNALDAYRDAQRARDDSYACFTLTVRRAREEGLSLDAIARELGVTKSTVQRWAEPAKP